MNINNKIYMPNIKFKLDKLYNEYGVVRKLFCKKKNLEAHFTYIFLE